MIMRLIDAEELLVRLSQYSRDDGYINLHMGTITTIVDNTPTVAERPHGEWVEHRWAEEVEGLLISNYECSCCHSWKREHTDFCPDCGASMKEGVLDGDV